VPSSSNPASSYREALRRIHALQQLDDSDVNPLCRTEFLGHGKATKRTILFLHGYTNCPQQFHQLSELFYERGYNVLNARIRYHGLRDRLTEAISQLTAQDLIDITNEIIDIGQGLGRHVAACGLSASGTAVAWAAQTRKDLDQAVIVAPGFVLIGVPRPIASQTATVVRKLPNNFVWWDRKEKANSKPDYAYPRFSTRSLGELMRLGVMVRKAAKTSKPLAGKILVITNEADPAVNNKATYSIIKLWEKHGKVVDHYEFEKSLNLHHDLIDPNQPKQQIDKVYPKLIELIDSNV
jgi:esterase/lipase